MKKLFVAIVAMGLAGFAQASYLYWQVAENAVKEFASGEGVYGVQVKQNGSAVTIFDTTGNNVGNVVGTTTAQNPGYLVDISGMTSESSAFYIELVQYNAGQWDTVGVSQGIAYSDIGKYTVNLNAIAPTLPAAWTGGSYAAPEPTSGLLMLLGVAALGLKRRKV